jgi:sensor histidine kinase YesM
MIGVGTVCALLIVPFNALLQHRGKEILFSGQSIAVQNFCENTSVLMISLLYSALLALGISLKLLMVVFGLLISISIFIIIRFNQDLKTQN